MVRAFPRHSVDLGAKEYAAIFSLLLSSKFQNGNSIKKFEKEFASYIGVDFAQSIPSARVGLYLLLKFFDFPKGSEVIITPFTHQSIFTVIRSFPLKPVFVDIDERTFNTLPEAVEKYITKKTRLIILTHMWGQPCQMDGFAKIREKYGLKIIEDCAMACGAEYAGIKVGSFFDAGIFSFGKAKAICTFGGGMLTCSDKMIFDYVSESIIDFNAGSRFAISLSIINSLIANILTKPAIFFFTLYPIMRFFNIRDPYNPIEHRKDSLDILSSIPEEWKIKMSNIQAAVGIEQLKNLDSHNDKRIFNAGILNGVLKGVKGVQIPVQIEKSKHIYLYYALYVKENFNLNSIRERLIKYGLDSQLNELTNGRQLEVFGFDSSKYPVFKEIADRLLIVPNGICLKESDALYVADKCKTIFQEIK